jgi:predicted TIM-barrel fold metal-dependent hydrolase
VLTADTPIISVDDHIIEPPHVWETRLPARFREQGPRVVELEDGRQRWLYEGEAVATVDGATGLSALAGVELTERTRDPGRFENMRAGCYDPMGRLDDMDADGVLAQVCFPNFARFSGTRFLRGSDHQLGLLCVRAYNDYVLEEWYGAAPDRLLPLIILPLWDAGRCLAEIERCVLNGARAITFPENPALLGLPAFGDEAWDPVFAAAEAAEMPVCLHFGSSGVVPALAPDGPVAATSAVMGSTLFHSMADLVFSDCLHKHPRLQVVYSEGGIGWFPFAIQRLDQVWDQYRHYKVEPRINGSVPPSELIRRQIHGCFIDDALGVELRHTIGIEHIMCETDFPHSDSVWPNSRAVLTRLMAGVPDEEVRLLVYENARRLFRFSADGPAVQPAREARCSTS